MTLIIGLSIAETLIQPTGLQEPKKIWSPQIVSIWQSHVGACATEDAGANLFDHNCLPAKELAPQLATAGCLTPRKSPVPSSAPRAVKEIINVICFHRGKVQPVIIQICISFHFGMIYEQPPLSGRQFAFITLKSYQRGTSGKTLFRKHAFSKALAFRFMLTMFRSGAVESQWDSVS